MVVNVCQGSNSNNSETIISFIIRYIGMCQRRKLLRIIRIKNICVEKDKVKGEK